MCKTFVIIKIQIYSVDNVKDAPLDLKPLHCAQPAQMYMVAPHTHTQAHKPHKLQAGQFMKKETNF